MRVRRIGTRTVSELIAILATTNPITAKKGQKVTVRTMTRPITECKLVCTEKDRERGIFCVEKEVLYLTTVYVVWVMNEIRVRGVAGMIQIGANRSTWKKFCPSATLFTMNPSIFCRRFKIVYSL
jgi:hypothetical protein